MYIVKHRILLRGRPEPPLLPCFFRRGQFICDISGWLSMSKFLIGKITHFEIKILVSINVSVIFSYDILGFHSQNIG